MKVTTKQAVKTGTQKARQQAGKTARIEVVVSGDRAQEAEQETAPIDPSELPIEDRIRAAFGHVDEADSVTVHIYRVAQNNQPEEYLFACGANDLDNIMDRVRDAFGSGRYRVRVYKNRRIATQFDFSVFKPPQPVAIVAAAPVPDSISARLLEVMERLQDRLAQPQAAAAPADRLDDLTKIADVIKKLAPEPGERFDLKTLIGLAPLIREGMALLREFAGGGEGGSSVWDFAKEALKNLPIGEMLAPFRAPTASTTGGTAYAAEPAPARVAPPQPQPQAPPVHPMLQVLKQPLQFLVRKAQANAPIDLSVDWMFNTLELEGVPDELLAGLLEAPDLLQTMIAIVPDVGAHQEWFSRLIASARAAMFTTEEGAGDDNPEQHPENSAVAAAG